MAGFGIILPSLPYHVEQLGGSGIWVGLLLTAYAAAQFVAAPVLGALSDRYGRRPVLLLTLLGSAVCMTLSAVAGSLVVLLVARALAGGCGGAVAVGQAYAADLVPVRRRTHALGFVGAAVGLGFVAGPAIGALLAVAGIGFAGSCLVAASLALVNTALGWALLPRTAPRRTPNQRGVSSNVGTRAASLVHSLQQPARAPAVAAIFLGMAAFACLETTLALLVHHRFGHGAGVLGGTLAGVGVLTAVTQAGLVGRLTDRYGHRSVGMTGGALVGLGLLALPLAPVWLAYASLSLVAVGHALLSTCAIALLAGTASRELGGVLGVGQSAAAAARAIAPVLAGAAYEVAPVLPYVGAAVACAAAILLLGGKTLWQARPFAVIHSGAMRRVSDSTGDT